MDKIDICDETVLTCVRRYEKLQVRTRTESVAKFCAGHFHVIAAPDPGRRR